MSNYAKSVFLDRREGRIVLFGSLVYLSAWALYTLQWLPLPPFYALMSPFVPIALALTYLQMGGFKRTDFESGWFNTGMLVVVLLVPYLVSVYTAIHK